MIEFVELVNQYTKKDGNNITLVCLIIRTRTYILKYIVKKLKDGE